MTLIHIGEIRSHPTIKGEYDICSIRSGYLLQPSNWDKYIKYSEYEKLKKQNAAFVKLIKEQALELDGTLLDDDFEEIDDNGFIDFLAKS